MAKKTEEKTEETPVDHICLVCANYDDGKCRFYLGAIQADPDNPITDCTAFVKTAPAAPVSASSDATNKTKEI